MSNDHLITNEALLFAYTRTPEAENNEIVLKVLLLAQQDLKEAITTEDRNEAYEEGRDFGFNEGRDEAMKEWFWPFHKKVKEFMDSLPDTDSPSEEMMAVDTELTAIQNAKDKRII